MHVTKTATALALVLGLGTAVSLSPSLVNAGQQNQGTTGQATTGQSADQQKMRDMGEAGGGGQQSEHMKSSKDAASQQQGQHSVAELRQQADELKGRAVVNQDGSDVGELSDIVLDQKDQPHGIVEVGGVLGIGAKEVAIPFDQLQVGQENITLMSQKSEDQLKQMQKYDETQYTPIDQQAGGEKSKGMREQR